MAFDPTNPTRRLRLDLAKSNSRVVSTKRNRDGEVDVPPSKHARDTRGLRMLGYDISNFHYTFCQRIRDFDATCVFFLSRNQPKFFGVYSVHILGHCDMHVFFVTQSTTIFPGCTLCTFCACHQWPPLPGVNDDPTTFARLPPIATIPLSRRFQQKLLTFIRRKKIDSQATISGSRTECKRRDEGW